jgi:hypothetical protein
MQAESAPGGSGSAPVETNFPDGVSGNLPALPLWGEFTDNETLQAPRRLSELAVTRSTKTQECAAW